MPFYEGSGPQGQFTSNSGLVHPIYGTRSEVSNAGGQFKGGLSSVDNDKHLDMSSFSGLMNMFKTKPEDDSMDTSGGVGHFINGKDITVQTPTAGDMSFTSTAPSMQGSSLEGSTFTGDVFGDVGPFSATLKPFKQQE